MQHIIYATQVSLIPSLCVLQVLATGHGGPILLRFVSQLTLAADDACEVVLRAARQNRVLASLNYSSIQKQLSVQQDVLQAVLMQVRLLAIHIYLSGSARAILLLQSHWFYDLQHQVDSIQDVLSCRFPKTT